MNASTVNTLEEKPSPKTKQSDSGTENDPLRYFPWDLCLTEPTKPVKLGPTLTMFNQAQLETVMARRPILDELNKAFTAFNRAAGQPNSVKGVSLGNEEIRLLASCATSDSYRTGFSILQDMGLKIIFLDAASALEVW